MTRKAVFLDRDGVINRATVRDGKPYPPAGLEQLEILPGVADAMARLKDGGFKLIVVTNQPDVARGTTPLGVVQAINARLAEILPIDEIRVCYHDSFNGCACRKPNPGMLIDAARIHGLDLPASYMVGDRWSDMEAGRLAGCTTFFVDYGYSEKRPEQPHYCVKSLAEAADIIFSLQCLASSPARPEV